MAQNQNFFLQCESLDDEEEDDRYFSDEEEDKESQIIYEGKSRLVKSKAKDSLLD